MNIIETGLDGVLLLEPQTYWDNRGYFMESYNAERWAKLGLKFEFVQENHSFSKQAGTIRGMHYQLNPKSQTKLVSVGSGAVYDVVVDMRHTSPDYGGWTAVILSAENQRQLLVPKGFAHGFCTLTDNVHLYYKVDAPFAPALDRGFLWSDPALGIDWPTTNVILSEKDMLHPTLANCENNY
jgi:dTDP-4-dehydrorhamnose 3,5-epimerase